MNKRAVIILVFVLMLPVFNSASAKDLIIKTDLKVGKLTCGGCLYTIKNELSKLKGFKRMGASLFKGEVYVAHSDELKAKLIEETITKTGYPAKIMKSGQFEMKRPEKKKENVNPQYPCCGNGYSCSQQNN